MTIEQYRAEAICRVELYEKRYQGCDERFPPLSLARRWARVFQTLPIDMDEVARIMRDAEKEQNNHDVAFYAFCNEIRRIYHDL